MFLINIKMIIGKVIDSGFRLVNKNFFNRVEFHIEMRHNTHPKVNGMVLGALWLWQRVSLGYTQLGRITLKISGC